MENRENRMEQESMTLTMDSLSKNEEFARVAVAVFASRLDPTLEELDDIKTAVSEAVTNAVIHGYQNGEGTIEICARAQADGLFTVTVKDTGIGIADIKKAMEPMFTTAPEGSGPGWDFPLWKPLWIRWRWFPRLGRGRPSR